MARSSAAVLDVLPLLARAKVAQRDAAIAAGAAVHTSDWTPLPHQVAPPGDWDLWLLFGGRGSGKTDAAAYFTDQHVKGPACLPGIPGGHRLAIIAPTLGDALEACVNGPSGLKAHNPGITSASSMGGTFVRWPGGAQAKLFGASTPEDVERLRAGGNRCFAWCEELAAWRQLDECWDHLQFGLRLGPHPRAVASTTPKPRKLLRSMLTDPKVAVTRATTHDNPHLAAMVRARLERRYAGTRLGRQEIGGELLEDVEGALWTYAMLEDRRPAPDLTRAVIGVDPSGGGNMQGIIACGLGVDGRGYVLGDRSCTLSPAGWGARAVQAYLDFAADRIVAERNFGGDMVLATVQTAAKAMGVTVSVKMVTASRGKVVRAQPISALYEQGRVSHVEAFTDLEDQLCTWTPEDGTSPDRLDALVWAMTDLIPPDGGRQAYVW